MSKISHQIPLLLLFLLFISSAGQLSFNFTPITAANVTISGDAYIDAGGVHIPNRNNSAANGTRAGQAILNSPLRLWDKSSNTMLDFTTHFTFSIASVDGSASFADGMTFFLAPPNSTVSRRRPAGERLGLGDAFVAVEFDTFLNGVDPPEYDDPDKPFPHVGIDLNDTKSVNHTAWRYNVTEGREVEAWIRYDAVSKILSVNFTGRNGSLTQRGSLSRVVDLREILPENVSIGFSASTGLLLENHNIRSWSFQSNLVSVPNEKRKKKSWLIIRLPIGLSALFLILAFACFVVWKKKKKNNRSDEEEFSDSSSSSLGSDFEQGTGPRKFTYNELVHATNNFNEQQKLGEGGFGAVYKGLLRSTNTHIAVKRVSKGSKQGRKEYASEIKIITQLRHMNLVHLMGWCHRRSDLLLVYEFMPNKSLDNHLFKPNSLLTWEMRYRIAQGLASALVYLHEELRHYVVHRDIKSSNIMLDANFNAKLGDFGLARLVDPEKDPMTTVPAGTIGYMAPEYLANWRASKETDIYSFGIVLLEIACGRKSIEYKRPQNQILLVDWVWGLYGGGRLLDGADPKLESSEDDAGKIERLMVVGLWCVHPDSKQRPSIRQVLQILNFEAPLPELPVAKPVAVFDFSEMVSGSLNSFSGVLMTGSSSLGSMSDFHPR